MAVPRPSGRKGDSLATGDREREEPRDEPRDEPCREVTENIQHVSTDPAPGPLIQGTVSQGYVPFRSIPLPGGDPEAASAETGEDPEGLVSLGGDEGAGEPCESPGEDETLPSPAQRLGGATGPLPRRPGADGEAHVDGARTAQLRKQGASIPKPDADAPRARRSLAPDANVGRVLGSYRLVRLLGEGGMGRVYLAEHTRLGRKVALKLLRPEYAVKREALQRFFQEARAVNAIGHANIVDVTDYVELEGGEVFFIMELLSGCELSLLLRDKEKRPSPSDCLRIALQMCDALQAAHDKGIIHRDLKPDNVFITEGQRYPFVKLLDFGVAKLTVDNLDSSLNTVAGSVIGTPAYMSPEQASGIEVDHRTDIYSLGAILYELFTGHPVFRAKSFGEYVVKHLQDRPVPPRHLRGAPEMPHALERVILRCLEKEPRKRYGSVVEVRAELEAVAALIGEARPVAVAVAGHAPGGGVRSRLRIPLWLGVVSTLVLALAGFWFAAGLTVDDVRFAKPPLQPDAASQAGIPVTAADAVGAKTASDAASVAAIGTTAALPDARATTVAAADSATATIRLELNTEPPGANVFRRGHKDSLGRTPTVLTLSQAEKQVELVFLLDGYKPAIEVVGLDSTHHAVITVALVPIDQPSDQPRESSPAAISGERRSPPPRLNRPPRRAREPRERRDRARAGGPTAEKPATEQPPEKEKKNAGKAPPPLKNDEDKGKIGPKDVVNPFAE